MKEFDLYLSLLSRVLRLAPRQRVEIADELRDHLEERFHELLKSGRSQDEAIRLALEELGDAAVLAADFTSVISLRRRRQLMRWTVRSIAALTAVILLSFALWPVHNQVAPAPAGAQVPGDPAPTPDSAKLADDNSVAATEAKLSKKLDQVNFDNVSLDDVLRYLSEQAGVDILVDRKTLKDEGTDTSQPITLVLEHTKVSAATALELALEELNLGYSIRDGLVRVSTVVSVAHASAEVQVYNCRDLLPGSWMSSPRQGPAGNTPGEPMPAGRAPGAIQGAAQEVPAGGSPPRARTGMAGMPGMPIGGMGGVAWPNYGASSSEGEALISTITATVAADTWAHVGGTGAISEFKGLLVVKQSQAVHREIRALLKKLRSAADESDATGIAGSAPAEAEPQAGSTAPKP